MRVVIGDIHLNVMVNVSDPTSEEDAIDIARRACRGYVTSSCMAGAEGIEKCSAEITCESYAVDKPVATAIAELEAKEAEQSEAD